MRRNRAEQVESSLPSLDWRMISALISEWFQHHQRQLVFRETRYPYRIWVSEIMLQQTTVAAVVPYYERFMRSFPDLATLAKASEDAVLAHWAGLGYYRRARQLHAAAQVLVAEHGEEFPQDSKLMQKLPGIGRYTAGAILSCAFDMPEPVLEANTVRVYARLANLDGVVGEGKLTADLWKVGEKLVEVADSPRDFNMGAMELGALVCKPQPECGRCPVQEHCLAYRYGRAAEVPVYPPKRDKVILHEVVLALRNGEGKYLVRRIEDGAWHAGMWEFPTFRVDGKVEELPVEVGDWIGGGMVGEEMVGEVKYTVTHHKITCSVFHCSVDLQKQEVNPPYAEWNWISLEESLELAMGSAQRKIVKILDGI